jgi:hypothetical protein
MEYLPTGHELHWNCRLDTDTEVFCPVASPMQLADDTGYDPSGPYKPPKASTKFEDGGHVSDTPPPKLVFLA